MSALSESSEESKAQAKAQENAVAKRCAAIHQKTRKVVIAEVKKSRLDEKKEARIARDITDIREAERAAKRAARHKKVDDRANAAKETEQQHFNASTANQESMLSRIGQVNDQLVATATKAKCHVDMSNFRNDARTIRNKATEAIRTNNHAQADADGVRDRAVTAAEAECLRAVNAAEAECLFVKKCAERLCSGTVANGVSQFNDAVGRLSDELKDKLSPSDLVFDIDAIRASINVRKDLFSAEEPMVKQETDVIPVIPE